MKCFNRYRRLLSTASLLAFVFGLGLTATPAQAHYNPKLGRFLQRDANGTALMLSPGLSQKAMNPTVTVSMAYELQFGDGMNFYEYLKSTPPNQRDPNGLFTLTEVATTSAISGAMVGGTLSWIRSYATFSDRGSNRQLATDFFVGAGLGGTIGAALGLIAGGIAGAQVTMGLSKAAALRFGISITGIMVAPTAVGLAIKEEIDAETYGERLMANIDLGLSVSAFASSHVGAFANPVLFKSTATSQGLKSQDLSIAALSLRARVKNGMRLYRIGTSGKSKLESAQFWATENPSTPGFAQKYGIPPGNFANADFIQVGTLKPGSNFVIGPAAGSGNNPGGALEVVVEVGGVNWSQASLPK